MKAKTFNLKIISPDKVFQIENTSQINLTLYNGDIGILANHAPLIAKIKICILSVLTNHKKHFFALAGGVLNVGSNNQVTIITEEVDNKEKIDKIKENQNKNKYEQLLKQASNDYETAQIEIALKKTINKLKL